MPIFFDIMLVASNYMRRNFDGTNKEALCGQLGH